MARKERLSGTFWVQWILDRNQAALPALVCPGVGMTTRNDYTYPAWISPGHPTRLDL